ncbi:MAG: transposase [Verrucomicrobiaceae bacterium]|nr:transposase [Verrucomicrobiaceae bacterium]
MENRIQEQQLDLFADHTSYHAWWANQFRLLLSSYAYMLIETIRRLGLRNPRRVQPLWSSSFPNQGTFAQAWKALSSALDPNCAGPRPAKNNGAGRSCAWIRQNTPQSSPPSTLQRLPSSSFTRHRKIHRLMQNAG